MISELGRGVNQNSVAFLWIRNNQKLNFENNVIYNSVLSLKGKKILKTCSLKTLLEETEEDMDRERPRSWTERLTTFTSPSFQSLPLDQGL